MLRRCVLISIMAGGNLVISAQAWQAPGSAGRQTVPVDCRSSRCAVALVKVATLRDRSPRTLGDYSIFVVQDRARRFFVATRDRKGIAVFNANGTMHTVLTHPEFQRVSLLPALDGRGSILVNDYPRRRLYSIDSNLVVRESATLPHAPRLVLADGRFVLSGPIRTPDRVGYPLHLMDTNGAIVRSFGAHPPRDQGLDRLDTRMVGPGAGGSVWAAAPGRYVLERWDPASGARLARVPVRSSWFVESASTPDERVPPTPFVEAVWEQDRMVWTLVRVADAAWKPPRRPNTERSFDLDEYEQTYDWVIEVIDPKDGEVVAHRRLPLAHWIRPPADLLVSRSASSPSPAFDVWKLSLMTKGDRQ